MEDKKQLIDPNEFWKQLNKSRYDFFTYPDGRCGYSLGTISDVLWRTKSVDAVEVVHGKAVRIRSDIDYEDTLIRMDRQCNKCGALITQMDNYCPSCGAKMDGDGNG